MPSVADRTEVPARPLAELGDGLPEPSQAAVEDARREVRAGFATRRERLFVVDDDPTGSQTVADVPLLLRFDESDLAWASQTGSDVVFALTNSRSLEEGEAVAINERLGARIQALAGATGFAARVLSRSDSTLRGHFPAEAIALDRGLRTAGAPPLDALLLCPAFVEAGRVTVDDVHWVRDGDTAIPVGETEFAHDPVFAYEHSDLREWVAERRSRAGMPPYPIGSVDLADVREGGPERVAELLGAARGGQAVVLNALSRGDLDLLAQGVARAEATGRRFLYRSGPSFVAARAGRATPDPLAEVPSEGHGLVVVGSHTDLTTRQVAAAVRSHDLRVVELQTAELAAGDQRRKGEIERVVHEAVDGSASTTLLMTSRAVAAGATADESVAIKATIAAAVAASAREIVERRRPGFVIAKGGITSHDLAAHALATGRATVLGQLFPGQVALWRLEDSEVAPGLPFVVFPGNVGGDGTLADALRLLIGGSA